jgi:hypothetical protein
MDEIVEIGQPNLYCEICQLTHKFPPCWGFEQDLIPARQLERAGCNWVIMNRVELYCRPQRPRVYNRPDGGEVIEGVEYAIAE